VQHRIVGPDETDNSGATVSCESPLGKALLGRELGEEVSVPRPKGPITFVIHAITFRNPG
jgi:transcription elongation GreA/GreB family factor